MFCWVRLGCSYQTCQATLSGPCLWFVIEVNDGGGMAKLVILSRLYLYLTYLCRRVCIFLPMILNSFFLSMKIIESHRFRSSNRRLISCRKESLPSSLKNRKKIVQSTTQQWAAEVLSSFLSPFYSPFWFMLWCCGHPAMVSSCLPAIPRRVTRAMNCQSTLAAICFAASPNHFVAGKFFLPVLAILKFRLDYFHLMPYRNPLSCRPLNSEDENVPSAPENWSPSCRTTSAIDPMWTLSVQPCFLKCSCFWIANSPHYLSNLLFFPWLKLIYLFSQKAMSYLKFELEFVRHEISSRVCLEQTEICAILNHITPP